MTIQKLSIPKYWKIQEKKKSKFESKNQFRAAFIPPPAASGIPLGKHSGILSGRYPLFSGASGIRRPHHLQLAREGGIEGGLDHAAGF